MAGSRRTTTQASTRPRRRSDVYGVRGTAGGAVAKLGTVLLLFLTVASVSGAGVGCNRPPAACRFTGIARVRLAPAPPGTVVEAWVQGARVAETRVERRNGESRYDLVVDGRFDGQGVVFRFPGFPGLTEGGRAVCEAGRTTTLDLSAEAHQGCGGA